MKAVIAALNAYNCIFHIDYHYEQAIFPGHHRICPMHNQVPPLLIGVFPGSGKMLAVYPVSDYSASGMGARQMKYLEQIQNAGGLAFVARDAEDVRWHLDLEGYRPRIRIDVDLQWNKFCRRFFREFAGRVGIMYEIDGASDIVAELLGSVMGHKDDQIQICAGMLPNTKKCGEVPQIYHDFLKHYRAIIRDIMSAQETRGRIGGIADAKKKAGRKRK